MTMSNLFVQSTELSLLEDSIKKKFTPGDGPFFSSLEKSLKEVDAQKQAYQGGTFIGNHVHKLLKVIATHQALVISTTDLLHIA